MTRAELTAWCQYLGLLLQGVQPALCWSKPKTGPSLLSPTVEACMVPRGHVATVWEGLGHGRPDTVPVMELGSSREAMPRGRVSPRHSPTWGKSDFPVMTVVNGCISEPATWRWFPSALNPPQAVRCCCRALACASESGALLFSAGESDPERPQARAAGLPFFQLDTCICFKAAKAQSGRDRTSPKPPQLPKEPAQGPRSGFRHHKVWANTWCNAARRDFCPGAFL